MPQDQQMQLDFSAPKLPPADEMPLNYSSPKTQHWVYEDFKASENYTIITGFSSLEFLLHFFNQIPLNTEQHTRIVLGHEDLRAGGVKNIPATKLSQEIMDYWLSQRISIDSCGGVLHLISLIEAEKVEFRILQGLHAKIYVGDSHAMLGSSNFSKSGLQYQKEANIRVSNKQPKYEQIRQVADYYYEQGAPFNDKIIDLLRKLLNKVTWEEALARSAALLIEGDWWKDFKEMEATLREFNLWPTQEQAIGRSLYILDNHGSVLVADPTGSGKTKLGTALHLTLVHRLWASGKSRRINGLLLSPPRVVDSWQKEYTDANSDFGSIVSHGTLSSGKEESLEIALQKLRNAHILLIDEAHNFINKLSNRSREIAKSLAEHIILFTATPINRKREDLFRIIELLDIDNFPDEIIMLYKQYAFKKKELTGRELERFQKVLHHFVVRRTKFALNQMIKREPERYQNRLGAQCKYPQQIEQTYLLNESEEDVAIAKEINQIAEQLVGITRLRKLYHVNEPRMDAKEQQDFLELRLKSSAALARYMVQAMLRSSTAALIEHIDGTQKAAKEFGLTKLPNNKDTGNIIQGIKGMVNELPECSLSKVELPFWLKDLNAFQEACQEEINRYKKIGQLARSLSLGREERKAQKLLELLKKHRMVIAFDRHIISLHYFRSLLAGRMDKEQLILATGGEKTATDKAKKVFSLESEKNGCLGLFSDAMSEGVNLQGASALVFLGMPSVVRLAEQRIGRIDRMDSPHESVEIFWPDDHEAFALKTDRRFFKTAEDVEKLIGGNFRIPEALSNIDLDDHTIIKGKEAIELRQEHLKEEEQEMAELLPDAFQAVEDLVFGKSAIISPELYEKLRHSQARVYANVSIVESEDSWAFFALEGAENHAPRWLFIDEKCQILTDLPTICAQLRYWLARSRNVDTWNEEVNSTLNIFTQKLHESQIEHLPPKKKRAIKLFQKLLENYSKAKDIPSGRKSLIKDLEQKLVSAGEENLDVDYDQFGKELIRYFQPYLHQLRKDNPKRVIYLDDLKKHFRSKPISDEDLKKLYDSIHFVRAIDRRVVACIIGVGREASSE